MLPPAVEFGTSCDMATRYVLLLRDAVLGRYGALTITAWQLPWLSDTSLCLTSTPLGYVESTLH